MKSIAIEGKTRKDLGKKSATHLRRNEEVPCVLYGDGSNVHFSAAVKAFKAAIYTPEFHKIQLHIDGASHEAIIKDVQYHPVSDSVEHVDFIKLIPGKSFLAQIPVQLKGLADGVKEGGKLILKTRKLDVRITPEHLVEKLIVDVTKLKIGKSIRIGELKYEGIEILNNPGNPVATCEVPRAMRGADGTEEGEEGADLEGETAPAADGEAAPAADKG